LNFVVLHAGMEDKWLLHLHSYKKYIVTDGNIPFETSNIIWHKVVPLKISLFAWRLPQNCIPTTYILIRWVVL